MPRSKILSENTAGPHKKVNFREDRNLIIHLTVTGRCNAHCQGCINSAITSPSDKRRDSIVTFQDTRPDQDTKIIEMLAQRHPRKKITVCFYGGEPFLAAEKMVETWQILRKSKIANRLRYMVYTNGELMIDAIHHYPDFIKNIWLFSVSIDGDLAQHNRARPGTDLNAIKENLKALRNIYQGNILMWSTLREEQSLFNCYEEFSRLYRTGLVTSFYWHWAEIVEPFNNFQEYATAYGKELKQIIDQYVEKIGEGKLIPIIHINELILYLLTGKERKHTACAIELLKNYDIVNGRVFACVDLPSHLGDVEKNYDLSTLVNYKNWLGCYTCSMHAYCGGRCPVQGLLGSPERTRQYCHLMKLHVGVIRARLAEIKQNLKRHAISLQSIYDRSAYLARYTDVIP